MHELGGTGMQLTGRVAFANHGSFSGSDWVPGGWLEWYLMFTGGMAFVLQVNTAFLSSTAPVCGAKAHVAAFTHWSTRFGPRGGLAVALQLNGLHSTLSDTLSRYEGARR